MPDFGVGDRVDIIMRDGKAFSGTILYFNDDYVVLSPGLGFPLEDIDRMEHA